MTDREIAERLLGSLQAGIALMLNRNPDAALAVLQAAVKTAQDRLAGNA